MHAKLEKLKTVSGKLRRMLSGHSAPPPDEQPMPRLLVVDDEESIRFSMREYFVHHGFSVDTASEIEEAERLIENTDYKVIIQDLRLGVNKKTDGLEIIRGVRSRHPETRIVVLTAYGSAEMEDEARSSGADAFLRKPIPLSQVAQVVQGLIESPPKHAAKSA
jgi:DNA-binding NtrC family response regulator